MTTTSPTRTPTVSTARRFLRWFDRHTLDVFNPPVVRQRLERR